MVSLLNTREMGPYLVCPSLAFTMAMEGMGRPPSLMAARMLFSSLLCRASSLSVSSTGVLRENLLLTSAPFWVTLSPVERMPSPTEAM